MKKFGMRLAFFAALWATIIALPTWQIWEQVFPQTLPPNTVWGHPDR